VHAWEEFENRHLKTSTDELTKVQVHWPLESPHNTTFFVVGAQSSKQGFEFQSGGTSSFALGAQSYKHGFVESPSLVKVSLYKTTTLRFCQIPIMKFEFYVHYFASGTQQKWGVAKGKELFFIWWKRKNINGDFDYQYWYVQKRIENTRERVCKCKVQKVKKDAATLRLPHVVTNSFQGGCLKLAQKIASKKPRNVILFMVEQVKDSSPSL
jgi:hypothetical protein